MRILSTALSMVLAFPLDWLRLSIDSWWIFFESLFFRKKWQVWEHHCVFCRDLDKSRVPRNMSKIIRYRHVWMITLLQPEISKLSAIKKSVLCQLAITKAVL